MTIAPAHPRPTVLLVDDRKENLSVLVDVLRRASFRVLVAEDGEAGVAQALRALPDVILLDIVMPVLDGYAACRALKANDLTRDIPVVFMSARHETVDRVRSFAAGGVDHVTKPFRAEEVLARVTAHARLSRQARSVREARIHMDAALAGTRDPKVGASIRAAIAALEAAEGHPAR
jgi:two-component system cell cycle sensor histidine kinase/response regulator CckA